MTGLTILFGLVLAIVLVAFRSKIYQWQKVKLKSKKYRQIARQILSKYFSFYRALPGKSQEIFERRVIRFIAYTDFVPREMERVSDEMKVLIAASAVQITFGFRNVLLDHFTRIIVYPDQFFSNSAQRYHKGEVNPALGTIVLSWKHFVEGYTYDEGINLGLHEMAHALQLENVILNTEYGFMQDEDIQRWQAMAAQEMEKIKSPQQSIFRDYAGLNQHEFFAVAVENFFERPKHFFDYNQALYLTLCRLLKQNPLLLTDFQK